MWPKASHPCFWIPGVAFSPFEDPAVEQARLKDKLSTGLVQEIWLQIGSDLAALRTGLEFLKTSAPDVAIYGSVFVPSEQLLRRFRERPWQGVDLTPNNYLESLQNAEAVTKQILQLYSEFGVLPLVESPVESPSVLRNMVSMLQERTGNAQADQNLTC
ncbi:FTSH10 [Symbiodinium pilosum]|uniref:FTSH10 protein n=1 Tax=Symbiodinium pilosum TaxID=2952 RepID=A0A812L9X6_SYMPI|nr:FTSH10 [Symbiodinium pilosum]